MSTHIEAAALTFFFDGRRYEVGGGGPAREYLSVRAVEFEAGGMWPTDEQLSAAIGLKVRFFEAGTRKGEGLYAFEPTPWSEYPHGEACEMDPCTACLRARVTQ